MHCLIDRRSALCVAAFFALGAHAGENGPSGVSSEALAEFARKFQAAVSSGQPVKVAELVSFPLRVNLPHASARQVNKREFISSYASIFTPEVRASVAAQDPQALFQSSKGAMFGNGEVWVASVCRAASCAESKLLVVSVNVPSK